MKCPRCKVRAKQKHHNSKWCLKCALDLRKRPVGKLTPAQERQVKRLAGTMPIKALAKRIQTSDSNLDRWAKQNGVNINSLRYRAEVVQEVCEFYAKHGKVKTQKRFPKVKVRSIVERYLKGLGHEPRQVRWTAEQLREVAQMGGLVSLERQAAYFARPGAHKGAMRSVWSKKFGHGATNINGLSQHLARRVVTNACPYYITTFWDHSNGPRRVALWVDVEKHINPTVPLHLVAAIKALAKFQRWLHGKNAKESIERILKEFE